MNRAIFIDRDNTIVRRDGAEHDVERVTLLRGAAHALASLRQLGFRIIVVANEGAVARGIYTEDEVDALHQRVAQLAHEAAGAIIDRFYYCPFHPQGTVEEYRRDHDWRKPKPGMLLQAAADLDLELAESWMVGDHGRDIEAGAAAGCQTILLGSGGGEKAGKPAADFCVGTLAEAAAVIAQNRIRLRTPNQTDPIVVTKVQARIVRAPKAEEKAELPATVTAVPEGDLKVADPSSVASSSEAVAPEPAETEVAEVAAEISSTKSVESVENENETGLPVAAGTDNPDDFDAATETSKNEVQSDSASLKSAAEVAVAQEEVKAEAAGVRVGDAAAAGERDGAGGVRETAVAGKGAGEGKNPPGYFALPPIQTGGETKAQTEGRTDRLLLDLLSEMRSWRARAGEFTPLRLFVFVALAVIMMGAVAAAIYLRGEQGLAWVGVAIVAQLTVIAVLLLNPR